MIIRRNSIPANTEFMAASLSVAVWQLSRMRQTEAPVVACIVRSALPQLILGCFSIAETPPNKRLALWFPCPFTGQSLPWLRIIRHIAQFAPNSIVL